MRLRGSNRYAHAAFIIDYASFLARDSVRGQSPAADANRTYRFKRSNSVPRPGGASARRLMSSRCCIPQPRLPVSRKKAFARNSRNSSQQSQRSSPVGASTPASAGRSVRTDQPVSCLYADYARRRSPNVRRARLTTSKRKEVHSPWVSRPASRSKAGKATHPVKAVASGCPATINRWPTSLPRANGTHLVWDAALYDALAENGSAKEVMKSEQLRLMARALAEMVNKTPKLDWARGRACGRTCAGKCVGCCVRLSTRPVGGRNPTRAKAGRVVDRLCAVTLVSRGRCSPRKPGK